MRLTNSHLVILSIIAFISFTGLIYYQFHLLSAQKKIAEQQLKNNLTAFNTHLGELKEVIKATSINTTDEYRWTWLSTNLPTQNGIEKEFIAHFDSLYRVYGGIHPYRLLGIMTNGSVCQVMNMNMGKGNPTGHGDFLNSEEEVQCLCFYSASGAFDIGYTLLDNPIENISFTEPTMLSVLLMTILIMVFIVTLYALIHQKRVADLRETFVNNLSHNIETPIFSISLAVKTLKQLHETGNLAGYQNYLNLIASENFRLKNYAEKMLHEALISAEKFEIEVEPVDLAGIIDGVIESVSLLLKNKMMRLQVNMEADNHVVIGDKTHLFNVFYNLLDNAVKYSDEHTTISIFSKNEPGVLCIIVKDEGMGMDAITIKNIFKKYYRGEPAKKNKGFGIGLSYVKRILDLHGVTIQVTSELRRGTEIVLKFKTE